MRAVGTGAGAATVVAGALLAEAVPSALILPTMLSRPPEHLGSLCRWRGPADVDAVAVTFDDGPDLDTPETLDLLDALGMRATFFVLGTQLVAHPDIARDIVARGHEVAAHGHDHRHHLLTSPRAIWRDMEKAIAAYRAVLGTTPRFYRPPHGQLTLATLVAARRHGLEVVLWSASGREWAETKLDRVLRRLCVGLGAGSIVLLHDNDVTCPSGTGDLTRTLLGPFSDELRVRGLRGGSVGELVDRRVGGGGASVQEEKSVVAA